LIGRSLARSLATAALAIAAYYLLPLDNLHLSVPILLVTGTVALTALGTWQLAAIQRAEHPGIRAIEGLATTIPLFLILFAAGYFLMSSDQPASFKSGHLTRTDALYFTVTVFSTVGFGDITATSQTARLVVTAQMILDLLLVGLGIRLVLGAVKVGQGPRAPH
jgi:hypothetical protein